MTSMRILTVRQPWAWAIIHGGKDVENRVRNIAGSYRGPVAIHAGLTSDVEGLASDIIDRAWSKYYDRTPYPPAFPGEDRKRDSIYLEYGAIIGVVDLVDVHTADDCWERDKQRLMSLYQSGPEGRREVANLPDDGPGGIIGKTRFCSSWAIDGHHHLVLANPRPLSEPIPYRGGQGLRTVPAELQARIEAAL